MDIVLAAALIAIGIVVAAAVYTRQPGSGRPLQVGVSPVAQLGEVSSKPDVALSSTGARAQTNGHGGGPTNWHSSLRPGRANGAGARTSGPKRAEEERSEALNVQRAQLSAERAELASERERLRRELEQVSGLSAARARERLLESVEDDARQDAGRRVMQIEDETRREADRRARNILAVAMQRLAATHAAEASVSVVHLSSDDLKGRIIGREGRNIRALENLTGVDFIIDDTPGAVVLSGFDGVRREVARLTLERLLQDGRVHPARIEEVYVQVKDDLDTHIAELGEQAALDAGAPGLHPELTALLGRLRFRTSYGQNVLAHSVEVAQLSTVMAAELGAGARTARRAGLLHDLGKAVTHEVEGPHAIIGADLARRYGESDAVAHAIEAHHNEVEPQTVEAVIVQAADTLSGARPGARADALESYVKRLRDLEAIANRHRGVEKVYAMQAGREIRVIVAPDRVDDATATLLSFEIAREIEQQLEYPGQIKVTVIRESRATDYAR